MAGGFGQKPNSKNKIIKQNNGEIIKDSSIIFSKKDNSSGTLSPGESVNFGQKEKSIGWNHEFLSQSLKQEQTVFVNQHTQEIKQEIEELRLEIKKLVQETQDLSSEVTDIEKAVDQNITEFSEYQINFFTRLKTFIINYRKNISEAQVWLESFNTKKNRRNAFWNHAKNKKSGGEQYLLSGEHSASRSAN